MDGGKRKKGGAAIREGEVRARKGEERKDEGKRKRGGAGIRDKEVRSKQ